MVDKQQKRWRKILYEDQSVPDNYVDSSFLDELQKNLHTRKYDYWTVCEQSGEVTQQISSLGLFVVAYVYMENGWLSPHTLFTITTTLTCIGYLLKVYIDHYYQDTTSNRTLLDDIKTALVFAGFSYGLSPVLVSLTETISTDTIYAMTAMMLLGNLVFHHYGANAALVSEALSLNAGLFASVCLASRLHTTWHSFSTVTFSIEIFGLWPMLRRNLRKHIPQTQRWLTFLLMIITSMLLWTFSTVAAIFYITLFLFITFICPAWLVSLQPLKNNIHGPWDEAVIEEKKVS
ncbi:GPI2 [Mytilus edulis]|nr:GPI2 [Mytilus edulis]VDI83788.1 phosphatidylinositol glycan, class C [Mytilus galloprovincialis]